MRSKTLKEQIVQSHGGAGLHVRDLTKMAAWYGELLNMPVQDIDPNTPFYIFDMDNGVNLMLDDYRNMTNQGFPIWSVNTSDINKAYRLIKDAEIPIVLDLQEPHPGLAYFNIEDSEGNVIMIKYSNWVSPNPVQQASSDHPIKNHLNSIIIPVKDLKRATEWYSKFLGYPIKRERLNGGPIYWFEMGEGTDILLDDNRNNQDLPTFPTLMFKVSNVYDAYALIKEKQIDIVREIQHDHYFMIKDIENNTIILCK
jgi:predicted enzyme related to lactoylglutathione lyase